MTAPIRFAIIGYGNIGRRHAQHILANREAKLVAVCDIDTTKAAELVPDLLFFETVAELVAAGVADVVCVCSPNYLHEPHALQVLKAGMHAVVEKPLAISVAAADRMIACSQETGKLIFAVKQNRYNPPVQALKKLIDDGGLGKLFLVQVNCFWNRGDSYYAQSPWRGKKAMDGGCLFTQFSHFVDILYYLVGKLESATGLLSNYAHTHNTEFEDTGTFSLKASNGAMVSFSFTTCAYEKNMEGAITLFAENGTVKIGGQYLNTIEYQKLATGALPDINIVEKSNDYGSYQGSMSNHDAVIKNVIDVLLHQQTVMVGAEEAREVVRTIEMMYAGAKQMDSVHRKY